MNQYTIILNSYVKYGHLFAQNGQLVPVSSDRDFHSMNCMLYSQEGDFFAGWDNLFFPLNHAMNQVTVYGDRFEHRFIAGCLAKKKRDSNLPADSTPHVTTKFIPEAASLSLGKRWQLFDSLTKATIKEEQKVAIILYGRFSETLREKFSADIQTIAQKKIPEVLKHGMELVVLGATSPEEVREIAQHISVGGVLATAGRLEVELLDRDTTRVPIVRLMPSSALQTEEISYDGCSREWFLWTLPVPQADNDKSIELASEALIDYIEHAIAKPAFLNRVRESLATTPAIAEALPKLTRVHPYLYLPTSIDIPRGETCSIPTNWSPQWRDVIPEVLSGYELTLTILENNIGLEVDGTDLSVPDDDDSYSTAEVQFMWNGGLDSQKCQINSVQSQISAYVEVYQPDDMVDSGQCSPIEEDDDGVTFSMLTSQTPYRIPFKVFNSHDESIIYSQAAADIKYSGEIINNEKELAGLNATIEGNDIVFYAPTPGLYSIIFQVDSLKPYPILCVVVAEPQSVDLRIMNAEKDNGRIYAFEPAASDALEKNKLFIAENSSVTLKVHYSYSNGKDAHIMQKLADFLAKDSSKIARSILVPECRIISKSNSIDISIGKYDEFVVKTGNFIEDIPPIEVTFRNRLGKFLENETYKSEHFQQKVLEISIAKDRTCAAFIIAFLASAASIGTAYLGFGISWVDWLVFAISAVMVTGIHTFQLCAYRNAAKLGYVVIVCALLYCIFEHLY